jgi:hypothetical protein
VLSRLLSRPLRPDLTVCACGVYLIVASVQGSGVMRKAIYAVVASAIFAASFFVALSPSAEVEARGSVPGAKTDRADARPLAGACSGNAWPYFEASCLRDARNPFGQARDVRLVSFDQAVAAKARAKQAR